MIETLFNVLFCFRFSEKKESLDLAKIKKILIIRNDNIGDLICSTPTIAAIRKAIPEAYIALLIQGKTKSLVEYNPDINKIYSYTKPKEAKSLLEKIGFFVDKLKMMLRIRKENFDLCVVLKSDFSSSQGFLSFASLAPFRIGHYPHKEKDLKYAFLYNIYISDSRTKLHEIDRCLNAVYEIGIMTEDRQMKVVIPPDILAGVDAFLKMNHIKQFISLHVISKRDDGMWDEETLVSLVKKLIAKFQVPVFLTYPPEALAKTERIKDKIVKDIFSIDTPNMLYLGAILKRASVFISPEGGQLHLSSALDIPTVGVFFREATLLGWEPQSKQTDVLSVTSANKKSLVSDIVKLVKAKNKLSLLG